MPKQQTQLDAVMRRRTIPKGAKYWWYFKTTILEQPHVRAEFSSAAPLDREDFYKMVRRLASPIKLGPSFCRSTKPSRTRANEEWKMLRALYPYYQVLLNKESPLLLDESRPGQGLGLYTVESTTVQEGKALFEGNLWGIPYKVSEEDFHDLDDHGFPSLYHPGPEEYYILCGPLALVNHLCAGRLCFSGLRQLQLAKRIHPLAQSRGIQTVARKRCKFAKGQEIRVDYFATDGQGSSAPVLFGGVQCRCAHCCHKKN